MAREETRGKRPFKLWDSWRNVRKGLVVTSFEELLARGREKLGVPASEPVRLVLESDGTQVEDGEYFRTLPNNTVLLLLRPGERWYPTGVDVIKAAISAIPKIVCETIHALELHDETPSWKIMDNKGRVTVVLHWDQRGGPRPSAVEAAAVAAGPKFSPSKKAAAEAAGGLRPSLVIQTSLDKLHAHAAKKETLINDVYAAAPAPAAARYAASPQITVINHDDVAAKGVSAAYGHLVHGLGAHAHAHPLAHAHAHAHPRLGKQVAGAGGGGSSSSFDGTAVHVHTPECANHVHVPRAGSPGADAANGNNECDFHCCALHEEGRKIAVHKSVATSPIQDAQQQTSPQPAPPPSSLVDGAGRRAGLGKGHVRFLDVVEPGGGPGARRSAADHESSESETENTVMEDEAVTSEKFLLLIDQLSVDQKRHLTIKDIGIILERLSSKILDVERLDRESESDDCYNWTIKATIRGDVLRELGVIYNGNYYAISEHPGYKEENEDNVDDVEEEEEEDRL